MEFEWDPAKAKANLRKHKVPLLMACEVFNDDGRLELPDVSSGDEERDEERWVVLGRVEQVILFVVYTLRGERTRLISARKADRDEQRTYWTSDLQA